ncbi:MAG: M56 family metallopeptidase, partial [Lachnospiraceae bacterium]|nr:M56 family metallopeptidase [Lachnospiraceae bacterium]
MGIMIQTAILVIAVLAVRKLFGERLHAYIRYSLWLLVVLRLLLPVNLINSPASLLRVTDMAVGRYQEATYVTEASGGRMEEDGFNGAVPDSQIESAGKGAAADVKGSASTEEQPAATADSVLMTDQETSSNGQMAPGSSNSPLWADSIWHRLGNVLHTEDAGKVWERLDRIFRIIRITGSLLVGGFLLAAHYRFQSGLYRMRKPLRKDQPDEAETLPVYYVKGLESPCLAGIFHPAVYIGSDIRPGSDYFRYITTHEMVHYLHGDHIWALLRAVLVTIYWFHPFVWIAAAASARDGEIACDYGAVRRLGDGERMFYGAMLLELSGGNGRKRIYSYGTMLRPGRSEMKERILRLAGGKGSRMWAGVLAVLFMLVVAGCAFTGTSQESSTDGTGGAAEADASSPGNEVIDSSSDPGDIAGNYGSPFGESDTSGIASGTESGDTDNDENSAAGDVFDPDENISAQRQLTAVSAALSEETPFGADGPFLDYAGRLGTGKESIIIFHDYFGLVVYDLTSRKVLHSLDLARIDCHMTQGDNACRIKVSDDGTTVWLHPGTRQYMFRYEVEQNLLYQVPIVKTFDIDLEAEELFDRYLVTEEMNESWHSNYLYEEYKYERGLQTAYIYLCSGDDEQRFGSLQCVWDD